MGGGHRITFGMTAGVAGDGGDYLLIDDPHPSKDGMWSEPNRYAVREAYDQELSTRLNDPTTSAVIIVMQRLHDDDLTGHVIELGGFVHLCLPMEYDVTTPCSTPLGNVDPRTDDGELLHPERMPREWVDKQKLVLGSAGTAGQFQQRPSPAGGGMFKESCWRFYTKMPEKLDKVVESWDLTFEETRAGSFVVGLTLARVGSDYYLLNLVRKRMSFTGQVAAIRLLHEANTARGYGSRSVLIENKANGAAAISTLRRSLSGIIPWPRKGKAMGSKVIRAAAWTPLQEAGNILLPAVESAPWVQEFINECRSFPQGSHDDQVDAASQAIEYLSTDPGLMFSV